MKKIKWDDFFQIEKNKMIVYQIIPHANATNNNKRLWKSIYKMYEMYERPISRLERNGWKFTYREKDLFWFDIIFKQEDGDKKIEFYVSTSEFQAVKLKRKLENKMQVTIKEADRDVLQVPEENTLIQEIKYLKHDIFSASTSASDTQTPISSILNTVDELQYDGDFVRLSICNEAENRQKWVKNAQWATEKIKKGNIPQRASVNGNRFKKVLSTGLSSLINEINDLLTETFQAFSNTFFKSEKKFEKKKVIVKSYSLEDEINAKSRNTSSLEKINLPVFKSHIRVSSHSEDRLTRETLNETISLSFGELSDNNEFHGIKVRVNGNRHKAIIKELNTLQLSQITKTDIDVNLISTDEMNKVALQMPGKDLQRRYEDELSAKTKVETDIPSVLRKDGIHIGSAQLKDQDIPIYMPVSNPDEFYRGYVFIGGQGNGKDTSIMNWIVDGCLNHGISAVIPDVICEEGHRGMANGIRDALPSEKIIDLDMSNEDYIIPMDLTEVVQSLGRKGGSRFASEIMDFFGDMEGMARSKKYLREAAKASKGSLYDIKLILTDEEFRAQRIDDLKDEGDERLAKELESWGTNKDLGNKADAIINRLDEFFGDDTLFNIFAQPSKPDVDFRKWMTEGKVIIIRIPNRILGAPATKTLVHWITLKTFMTRMLMTKDEQKNGCFMVFNEPEQFETEGLSNLMGRIGTEGRKERMGSIYAFHHWNKLKTTLQENLLGGGVNQFLFANDHMKTFELSKHRLEPLDIEDAAQLPKFHSIMSVRAGGELQHAFICQMKPPVDKPYDNSFLTQRHARMYGRPWAEVEKMIIEKEYIS